MKKPRQLVNVEVVCTPVTDVDIIPVPITGVDIEPEIAPGIRGATFIPAVSSEGIISWTNDGDLPNPDPVSIKGPQGDPTIINGKTGASIELTYEDVGAVPTARTVNGLALSSDIVLTAEDVGALPSDTHIPADQVNSDWNASIGVSSILNKPAIPSIPEDIGAVPTSRIINGYALSSDVNLTAHDVGALSSIDFDVIDCGSSREVV